MKIQCTCGAKYSFDVTPEMVESPVRFVCPTCGLDSSEFVNELIRREFGTAPLTPVAEEIPAPAEVKKTSTGRLRVAVNAPPPAPAPLVGEAGPFCLKHPGQPLVEQCRVCSKPICGKCMELFGYVCSPLCLGKAELQGIALPEFRGKKSAVTTRHWRKVGLISAAIALVVGSAVGFWFWYAWFGSVPKPVYSLRFEEMAYSGRTILDASNQLVFLHGDILARHDIKKKERVWSRSLLDPKDLEAAVAAVIAEYQTPELRETVKLPSERELKEETRRRAERELELHVRGRNIWVLTPVTLVSNDWKLVRFDWDTGEPVEQLRLGPRLGGWTSRGDELLMTVRGAHGGQAITHINLATGEWHIDRFILPPPHDPAWSAVKTFPRAQFSSSKGQALAGLPGSAPGEDSDKPLDPAKVAQQVQSMSLPRRIALPATLSSALYQERVMKELDEESRPAPRPPRTEEKSPWDRFRLVPCADGYVQFAFDMLEERMVERQAMKDPPAKSVIDGNLNASKTMDAANEILNDMQRNRGGSTVVEDESRYQVTLRRPDLKDVPDWVGEVIGPPSIHPLKSVNVIAAGKMIVVLDKSNKKLWQATLGYKVADGGGGIADDEEENALFGESPCIERGQTLYIIDEAVLTAFDLETGNVRWRLPSVGTVGCLFDDEGMLYVNTTTASPDSIKYSRQIDVSSHVNEVVLKIDPNTGKILWSVSPGGRLSRVTGKYIYTLAFHQADESDNARSRIIGEMPSFTTIRRLDARNGHVLWEYQEDRAPLDVQFEKNCIRIVFKKEVEVLKFMSL